MNKHRKIDLSSWMNDQHLGKLSATFIHSIDYIIKCHMAYNDECFGYVMSTKDGRSFVYGTQICRWISLQHDEDNPQEITSILDGSRIHKVDYGYNFVVILTKKGSVYLASDERLWKTGNRLKQLTNGRFMDIACGQFHLLLLNKRQKLFALGFNGHGQVTKKTNVYTKMRFTGLNNVVKIRCGRGHSLALDSKGNLFGWGCNHWGQLGVGDYDNRYQPVVIRVPGIVDDFYCGELHTIVRTKTGTLYGCGQNTSNQIGVFRDNIQWLRKPKRLPFCRVAAIATAWHCSFTLTMKDDSFFVCGKVNYKNNAFFSLTQLSDQIKDFSSAASSILNEKVTFGWCQVKSHNQ